VLLLFTLLCYKSNNIFAHAQEKSLKKMSKSTLGLRSWPVDSVFLLIQRY